DGTAALADCVFENNKAGDAGGAICSEGSSLTTVRCSFLQNRGSTGGAVEYSGNAGTVKISNCTFSDNATPGESVVERGSVGRTGVYLTYPGGGALHVSTTSSLPNISESDIDVTDCLFERNSTTNVGGAVYVEVPARLQRCRFIANHARYGGAVCTDAKGQFTNCLFAGNCADSSGGAVACAGANDVLMHCTFAGNVSPSGRALASQLAIPFGTFRPDLTGGAIGYVTWGGKTTLGHCIVWDGSGEFAMAESLEVNVAYSDVFGGREGEGNIQVDPCFADAGYWDPRGTPADSQDDAWVNGDYHLKSQGGRWNALEEIWVKDDATSPCVDAGDPNRSLGDELFPNGGVVNLGAYAGTTQASKSWFGAPAPEVHLAGDINGDGTVDLRDLFVVISQWSIGTPPPVQERLFIGIVTPRSGTNLYVGAQPIRFLALVSIFDAAVTGVTFTIRHEEGAYSESFDAQEALDGWSIAWPPADAGQELPPGRYVITAQAADEKGRTAVSPSITVSLSQRAVRR
ncbi:MAG: right-handed parallel beta-helix repeat-containing protein, partial [Phycisphaerales bacterium]